MRPAGSVTELQIAGRGGVPAGASSAAMLNITAVDPRQPGFRHSVSPAAPPDPTPPPSTSPPGSPCPTPHPDFKLSPRRTRPACSPTATPTSSSSTTSYVATRGASSIVSVVPGAIVGVAHRAGFVDRRWWQQWDRDAPGRFGDRIADRRMRWGSPPAQSRRCSTSPRSIHASPVSSQRSPAAPPDPTPPPSTSRRAHRVQRRTDQASAPTDAPACSPTASTDLVIDTTSYASTPEPFVDRVGGSGAIVGVA